MKKILPFFLVFSLLIITCCAAYAEEWKCESCGTLNTGKFCSECGAAMPSEEWTCPECQTKNTGKFCSECGAKKPEEDNYLYSLLTEKEQKLFNYIVDWAISLKNPSSLKFNSVCSSNAYDGGSYIVSLTYIDSSDATVDEERYFFSGMMPYIRDKDHPHEQEILSEADISIDNLNQAYSIFVSDPTLLKQAILAKGQKIIDRQREKIEYEENRLERWIKGGQKSEEDIKEERDRIKRYKDKLNELLREYGFPEE